MNEDSIELLSRPSGDGKGWDLLAPTVGYYAQPPRQGHRYGPGEHTGTLIVLQRNLRLRIPAGVAGFVANPPPELRHQPVSYGEVLFSIQASSESEGMEVLTPAAEAEDLLAKLVVRAPQAGRFYRKPDPDSPEYVQPNDVIGKGKTIGLLEVMKTFNPVKYDAAGNLPEQAKVVRFLVDDGADVEEQQPILELTES